MNRWTIRMLRCLALGHFGWGGALLAVAGWFAYSAVRVVPHMSTGTLWTNLPICLAWGAWHSLPWLMLGVWMINLGGCLWSRGPRLRPLLLWSHAILLAVGVFNIWIGIHAVQAAEISTARGGGLLSPLAWIPFLFGLPVTVLAAFSLPAALLTLPVIRPGGAQPEDISSCAAGARSKPFPRLLLVWVLLAGGFSVVFPAIWPATEEHKLAEIKAKEQAQRQAAVDGLRKLARQPAKKTAAYLRRAIMAGRLGVMMLTDEKATTALAAANLPVVFECSDILERESAVAWEHIERQKGPRTREDGKWEDKHLDLMTRISDLQNVLRAITQVPADLEPFLVRRASAKEVGRLGAISLISRLDIPAEKRRRILESFLVQDDPEAVKVAQQALARMGAQVSF